MIHIFPTGDLKEHETEGTSCHCRPSVLVENGEMIIRHNSYDKREFKEFDLLEGYGKETHYRYIGNDPSMNSSVWHYYKNYSHNGIDIDWLLDTRKRWVDRIGDGEVINYDDDECRKEIAGCDLVLKMLSSEPKINL